MCIIGGDFPKNPLAWRRSIIAPGTTNITIHNAVGPQEHRSNTFPIADLPFSQLALRDFLQKVLPQLLSNKPDATKAVYIERIFIIFKISIVKNLNSNQTKTAVTADIHLNPRL